ncbi:MAG: acyl-CoA dehydratase activase-related protein, partial [Planctomycetota bacterium]|nr:acyl-CoA dehydratase activase-related protein [Planctomycetota bacterium]
MGDKDLIRSLAKVAAQIGFSRRKGTMAALAGLEAQQQFETAREKRGRELLEQIRQNNQLGVVLFARSYVSQDSGANLGIDEKLAQLGVVPIPLDFLPLSSVNVKQYSDRPYWFYESKHIAGAHLTALDPHLYGLVLTTFSCGPNSFVINLVEDIMGSKPLGHLEIDEHAAEAGIVTRLEAFVDTIKSFARSSKIHAVPDRDKDIRRAAPVFQNSGKILLLPRMASAIVGVGAAMEAFGVRAIVLPEANESNLLYANKVTTGKECLPYRVTLGDFMRFFYENGDVDLNEVEGGMAGAYGPCRLGKYALEQGRLLRKIGFDLPIRTTVSNSAYRDLGLGSGFERLAWKSIVAIDSLERLLWRTRPYEKSKGGADRLFEEFLAKIAEHVRHKRPFDDVIREIVSQFKSLID